MAHGGAGASSHNFVASFVRNFVAFVEGERLSGWSKPFR
jgi:hypothetical protein